MVLTGEIYLVGTQTQRHIVVRNVHFVTGQQYLHYKSSVRSAILYHIRFT